jgi:predicted CoA-substrate-specific enzyme activase
VTSLALGLDVGSTTVKGVLLDPDEGVAPRLAYRRHHGALLGSAAGVLAELAPTDARVRLALTGSGGRLLAERLQAPYVHEVVAVSDAVLLRHPGAGGFIDLGGQDAKLTIYDRDERGSVRRVDSSMNDRCAAGTGATLDRCLVRLGRDIDIRAARYDAGRVRPLSSKCGVFAETDLVNLARAGVPADDLLISLADAIVLQCLAVLARGRLPPPPVILLGGPHVHFPALAGAWRHHLAALWRRDGVAVPSRGAVEAPPEGLYYAALGAVTRAVSGDVAPRPIGDLARALEAAPLPAAGHLDRPFDGLVPPPAPRKLAPAGLPRFEGVAVGIDAGSTAIKAIAVDGDGRALATASRRSDDPIANARAVIEELRGALARAARLDDVRAVGVTGYAAPLLAPLIGADAQPVETAAHARAARAYEPKADVVCDVGGQDIKVLLLGPWGEIRDFRISSQCNAGIGMVLETTARELGVPLERYAELAGAARRAPRFGDGCVVFLDADRVTFQRQGFSREEILAGLARALPRVIWEQIMNGFPLASLGRTFVLQGGVQRNAAAVRAEREYLAGAVANARVVVHPLAAEAGAFGAALAAMEARPRGACRDLCLAGGAEVVAVRSNDDTRCRLCPNACARTVVTIQRADGATVEHVAGFACAEGATLARPGADTRSVRKRKDLRTPNLLAEEARRLFTIGTDVAAEDGRQRRFRIGIPRVLSMYRAAPFFRGYLQALGVARRDVVFSPPTSTGLWRAGLGGGASDPCFPVKVTLAHVDYLIRQVHDSGEQLDAIFVPSFTHALTPVQHAADCASCPVVAAAPALVKASLGQPGGPLARRGIGLIDAPITITDARALPAQMFEALGVRIGATRAESDRALATGLAAMRALDARLQSAGREVLDRVARDEAAWAVLVLGRPYHADPGICHRVGEELQALELPVLGIRSLPRDAGWMSPTFAAGAKGGADTCRDPFDVRDLVRECGNSGSNERLWAARVAARHPRVAVVDLSSFKCAQDPAVDAPIRALLDEAGVPLCALHDLDETRPTTALRLRLRTLAHALSERGWQA